MAAELGRLGYVAAPFAGNIPMYDLLAANKRGHAIPIQVKAINGGAWQFSADQFLKIEFNKKAGKQEIKGRIRLLNPKLLCIFVLLKGGDGGSADFYIFLLRDLRNYCVRVYKPRGRGSKNPESKHCAVRPKDLERFRDNWALLKSSLSA